MRLSEFRLAVAEEFGEGYARVLLRDHHLRDLEGSANEALERGVPARTVWEALCSELDVPVERRHGRGLREPSDR